MGNYLTVEELRRSIDKVLPDDNDELEACIGDAEDVINNHCNRPDGFLSDSVASVRLFPVNGGFYAWIDEAYEVTQVARKNSASESAYEVLDAGDWVAFAGSPEFPNFNRPPFDGVMITATGSMPMFHSGRYSGLRGFRPDHDGSRILPMLQVTAKWGYAATVPPAIKRATRIMAARYYKRGQTAYADTVGSAEMGGVMAYRRKLDPEVEEILDNGRFIRPAIAR